MYFLLSNEIRRKPEMTKANPNNDMLFSVIQGELNKVIAIVQQLNSQCFFF